MRHSVDGDSWRSFRLGCCSLVGDFLGLRFVAIGIWNCPRCTGQCLPALLSVKKTPSNIQSEGKKYSQCIVCFLTM